MSNDDGELVSFPVVVAEVRGGPLRSASGFVSQTVEAENGRDDFVRFGLMIDEKVNPGDKLFVTVRRGGRRG